MIRMFARAMARFPLVLFPIGLFSIVIVGQIAISQGEAFAQVSILPRQAAILDPGIDGIWGTYIIAVENAGPTPAEFEFPVTLPKETADFKAQAGVTDANLFPMPGGGLQIKAMFAPGQTLIAIGFEVHARGGRGTVTFVPKGIVQDLSVMTPLGSLTINSADLQRAPSPAKFGDRLLDALISQGPLTADRPYVVEVLGIPESRRRLWWLGGCVGFGLFAALFWVRMRHFRR